jgi:hypothetical protein
LRRRAGQVRTCHVPVTGTAGYSRSYGKGITRAFRHALGGHKSAKLIWWDDAEWEAGADYDDPRCKVYIDGAALTALRGAV